MSAKSTEQRLRHFLIWVVGFIFIGTVFELILLEHYTKPLQFIPYILSGAGMIALVLVRVKPVRGTVLALRWVMAAVTAGSLLGMYLHFNANMTFTRSINPTFTYFEALWPAMKGGNPLLAPGILFLAGILGVAITYKHPRLEN